MEAGRDEPSQGGSQQSGLVDMTVTEDNPIIIRRQMQQNDLVPAQQTPDFTEMMSEFQENVSGAVMPANSSQQITLHSRETPATNQLIPVEIAGGTFDAAHIGPKNMTAMKNVGVAGGDFRGAHIGNAYYTIKSGEVSGHKHENPESNHSSQQDAKLQKNDGERCQLSESISFFKTRRLVKKATIFEGVKTSQINDDEPLAIKLIWHYTEKNEREAKILLKLRPHTHVVAIVDAGVYKRGPGVDCLFIAMEKCSVLNLENYIKERRSANSVLFSCCGRYLKMSDFGMSKQLKNGCSTTDLSTLKVGTDGYRAPETYNQDVISKMADIFSLALVLYHLLSYGFHPFGNDEEIWNFNIKKGKGLDLSRLRVPFLKIAKELLEKMLKFEPEDRLKIDQVKDSEFTKIDWFSSVIENFVLIWTGPVKDHVGAVLSCQLYRSPSLQEVVEIDGSDWKFQMNTVPYLNIGSLKKVIDEEPSGYIVTSKDELRKLTDKLVGNNLMGWIDISKDGKAPKVILLIFKPGYPELFGFFVPDAKILTSLIGNLANKQRPKPQKHTAVVGGMAAFQSSNVPDPSTVLPTRKSPNLQAQSGELSSAPVSMETSDITSDIIAQEEVPSARNRWKTSPDLIPWWIFTGVQK